MLFMYSLVNSSFRQMYCHRIVTKFPQQYQSLFEDLSFFVSRNYTSVKHARLYGFTLPTNVPADLFFLSLSLKETSTKGVFLMGNYRLYFH